MNDIPIPQIIRILVAVLLAQVVFNMLLHYLMPVPLIVIGVGQFIPAALVLIMASNYRATLIESIRHLGDIKTTLIACLFAAITILICAAAAFTLGGKVNDAQQIPSLYPFAAFIPELSLIEFLLFLMLIGPFVHLMNATGEEVFWRGYLLQGLGQHLNEAKAVFLSGFFWGIWHIPMVVFLNWVFPQPIIGSILFTTAMITWGYVLAYIRLKNHSLWPPILMHATANAFVIGFYDSIANAGFNVYTSPWGLLGIIITLPIALFLHWKVLRK